MVPGKQCETALILGNAMGLISAVVCEVVGDDVANTVGGQKITDDLMDQISAVQIQKQFDRYLEK